MRGGGEGQSALALDRSCWETIAPRLWQAIFPETAPCGDSGMRSLATTSTVLLVVWGCAAPAVYGPPPMAGVGPNPILIPAGDPYAVWETVADVVDDYFRIEREEPTRLIGCTRTEGYLRTFPEIGATVLEPWRGDSVGAGERIESTLQSIRRRAEVRVIPATGGEQGYWVDLAVFKELEDVVRPEYATAGAATLRYDNSLTRVVNPENQQQITAGWIPLGRDAALEQRMLAQLQWRFAGAPLR